MLKRAKTTAGTKRTKRLTSLLFKHGLDARLQHQLQISNYYQNILLFAFILLFKIYSNYIRIAHLTHRLASSFLKYEVFHLREVLFRIIRKLILRIKQNSLVLVGCAETDEEISVMLREYRTFVFVDLINLHKIVEFPLDCYGNEICILRYRVYPALQDMLPKLGSAGNFDVLQSQISAVYKNLLVLDDLIRYNVPLIDKYINGNVSLGTFSIKRNSIALCYLDFSHTLDCEYEGMAASNSRSTNTYKSELGAKIITVFEMMDQFIITLITQVSDIGLFWKLSDFKENELHHLLLSFDLNKAESDSLNKALDCLGKLKRLLLEHNALAAAGVALDASQLKFNLLLLLKLTKHIITNSSYKHLERERAQRFEILSSAATLCSQSLRKLLSPTT